MLQSTDRHTRQIGQSSRSIGRIAVLVTVAQKGKRYTKKPKDDKLRVRRDHPRCTHVVAAPHGVACACGHNTRDLVIQSKFHREPFRGFGATEGRNLVIPITLAISFYNSLYCCARWTQADRQTDRQTNKPQFNGY